MSTLNRLKYSSKAWLRMNPVRVPAVWNVSSMNRLPIS